MRLSLAALRAEVGVTAAGKRTFLFLEETRQKEPGGAFEPFGLPDPPGRFFLRPALN
jgi:hypothetical protein